MKNILVPTDFSDNANKALEYASKLALEIDAQIIVMNSYQIPAGTANVMINFADILEKDSKEELDKNIEKFNVIKDFSKVNYTPFSCYGYLTEAIELATRQYKIDLIVMGTTGVSNMKNRFFGSNTVDTIRKIEYPIVVIPSDVEYKSWNNIILASNQDENILNAVNFLKKIIDVNSIKLDIVSVLESESLSNNERSELKQKLKGLNFDLHQIVNPNVVEGILDFTSNNDSDIVILIRRTYSFIERILHSSVTKQLALHSKKPLLLYKV